MISVAGERSIVSTSDDELEGSEYRQKLVRKLCLDRWAPSDAINLVKMFKDVVDLRPDELDMVVEKACSVMTTRLNQTPMDIPPLVYQTLVLCRGTSASQMMPSTLPRLIGALARLYQKSFDAIQKKGGSDELDSADVIGKGSLLKHWNLFFRLLYLMSFRCWCSQGDFVSV